MRNSETNHTHCISVSNPKTFVCYVFISSFKGSRLFCVAAAGFKTRVFVVGIILARNKGMDDPSYLKR